MTAANLAREFSDDARAYDRMTDELMKPERRVLLVFTPAP